MATYEEYMDAARNADAAGDAASARQLVQAAIALQSQPEPAPTEGEFRLGTLKENLMGDGKVDTAGEYVGEAINAAGAGALRGVRGMAELPEMAGRGILRIDQEGLRLAGYDMGKSIPVLDTATGRALGAGYQGLASASGADPEGMQYRGETNVGKYAGTIGEFLPAAVTGGTGALRTAIAAGVGSEAAGQATEGTFLEPAARIIGAFAAPAALSKVNKTVSAFSKRNSIKPTTEGAMNQARAAYKAVDEAGIKYAPDQVDAIVSKVGRTVAFDDSFAGYTVGTQANSHIDDAIKTISAQTGRELNLSQLEQVRRDLKQIQRNGNSAGQNKFDPRLEKIIGVIDEAMDVMPSNVSGKSGKDLLTAARGEFTRAKKAELLDDLMLQAKDKAGASGSGGNVVNSYRQAINSILKNKTKSSSFSKEEIDVMREFVRGNMSENALRLVGKLSPTGNGLMQALNIAAFIHNPAMILGTIAGTSAKIGAEMMTDSKFKAIKDMILTGVAPEKRKLLTDSNIRIMLGLQAN